MKIRTMACSCALAAALLGPAAPSLATTAPSPATAAPRLTTAAPAPRLPVCAAGPASTHPPTGPPSSSARTACRAVETAVLPGTSAPLPIPVGYQHLGAGTGGVWGGVSGRIEVVDGAVRPGTDDFLAGRFMVKRDLGGGNLAWLEAGWAETGWASPGKQHVYTYDTNTRTWHFYDQYPLKPGDRAWLDLHTNAAGVWQSWLWWNNTWNLLTAQKLPLGPNAYVEQYVEVHSGTGRLGQVDVPPILIDNVKLRPPGGGPAQFWRSDVSTMTGDPNPLRLSGLCLTWINQYDTWTAGNCPPGLPGLPGLP
ncbi:MAG: hypothetical protein QOH97_3944 [Actinoplanes sp.]|nr:hypothetical protein [Actinoplanes sp.]